MRNIVLICLLFSAMNLFGQIPKIDDAFISECECTRYYSPTSAVSIALQKDNKVELVDERKSHTIFNGNYRATGNTLTLTGENNDYAFLMIDNGVLQALGKVEASIKNEDRFYCTSFRNKGYRLFFVVEGENWGRKNGKIDGTWIFRDDKYNFYQLTFREGELLRKSGLPIYNGPIY